TRTGETRQGGDYPEDVIGVITLDFRNWQQRRTAPTILEDIRQRTANIPGIIVEPRKQDEGPPTGKPIQVQLTAQYPGLLEPAVEHVRRGLAEIGGTVDIEDTRPSPGIEWEVQVDRAQAAKFGLDVTSVGQAV